MATQKDGQTSVWAVLTTSGEKFCEYDSLDGFVDSDSSEVPTEPQELGSLYSYNKVRQASEATVTLLFNGDYSTQGAALAKLRNYLSSTDVFTIQTPNRALDNMTVVGVSVTRTATKNANMLEVEVTFKEVMSYYKAKKKFSPASATSQVLKNGGNVQQNAMDKVSNPALTKDSSWVESSKSTFNGIKESVSSAVATANQSIETVRANVASYVDKVRAIQEWSRTQMTSVSSEVSAVKSTFTTMKEVVSFNGIERTLWTSVNNIKDTKSAAKALLEEIGL